MTNLNQYENQSSPSSNKAVIWVLSILLLISVIVIVWLFISNNASKSLGTSGRSDVVKKVNGTPITKAMIYDRMPETYVTPFVDRAIEDILVSQEAEKANITVSEQEVEEAVNRQIDMIQTQFSEEQLHFILDQQGLTMDDLKNEIKLTMPTNLKLKKLLGDEIEVTEEEAKAYFEENKQMFNKPKQVRASHILVESEELAEQILQDLHNGADFAELAIEHSIDPGSKHNGGDLDFFEKETMVEEFSEAAFQMEIGEISPIVQTEYGYHIIKVTDIREAEEFTFADKKQEVEEILFDQKFQPIASEYLDKLKSEATIE